MKKILHVISKLYGLLLCLYPRDFREEFGGEMLFDFVDTVETASKRGMVALFVVLLRELRDFPISLSRAHLIKEHMFNLFQPESARKILRIAFAFGLALAAQRFTGFFMNAVISNPKWYSFLRFAHTLGWQFNYKFTEQIILDISQFILGPVLAGLLLLLVLPETRKIKRYLFVSMLALALPDVLNSITWSFFKNATSVFIIDGLFVGNIILGGLGFGILFSVVLQDRKKIPWLLFAGVLGYFLATWSQGFLIWRFVYLNQYLPVWKETFFIAMVQILMGVIVGALLGVVSVWSRQKVTLA